MAKAGKNKTSYVCNDCGATYPKWQGQCADCGAWNSLSEFVQQPSSGTSSRFAGYAGGAQAAAIRPLSEVSTEEAVRTSTGLSELDRVLGGGMVLGSVTLIGGDPGIGKSTLLTQAISLLSQQMPA